jgi:acyl carrier protein
VIGMTREQLSELCVISLVRIPRDTVEADAKFSRLGLDSAMVVYLMIELAANLPNTGFAEGPL